MKHFSKIATCAMLLIIIAACEQKITQQVVLDPALLETLKGKGTDAKTPSRSPSNTPSPISSSTNASPIPIEDSSILQVIRMNAEALNSENFVAYRNTFHPDSAFMQVIQGFLVVEVLYEDLVSAGTTYEIQNLEAQNIDSNVPKVVATIEITDFGGTIRNTLEYTLKKSGSEWKIFSVDGGTPIFVEGDDF